MSRSVRPLLGVLLAGLLGLQLAGCGGRAAQALEPVAPSQPLPRLTPAPNVAGDPERGRQLFLATGCGGCHSLRGLPTASGVAGPNLTNVVLRPTLAGSAIPMTPDNLTAWLLDPSSLEPSTPMPAVGLMPEQARDIAAFLYSQPSNPLP